MPEGFALPDSTVQYWSPYVVPDRGARNFLAPAVVARMAPGATPRDAERETNTLLQSEGWKGARYQLVGLQDDIVAPVKPALLLLVGAVGLVLLIACVNVTNLLLVRTASREIEIALRRAIGASPGRLLRQLLTESTLLALLGAVAGTALAYGAIFLLRALATTLPRRDLGPALTVPRLDEIAIDARVLLFTIALAVLTGIVCGLIPAWRHSTPSRADVLRERVGSPRVSGTLVVAEIAMAMVLLVGGGLLIHSFIRLSTTERGYDTSNVVTFQAAGRQTIGPPARAFADQMIERLASLPGVTAVGYSNNLPLVQQGLARDFSPQPPLPGQPPRLPRPGVHAVSPDFARAIGLRIVEGRGFSAGDAARREALVTRAFARSTFFDGPALGAHIYAGRNDWEVVGILEDVKQFTLQQKPSPELFIVDFTPPPPGLGGTYFAVRTSSDAAAITAAVRQVVRDQDAAATVENVATMAQIVSNAMARPRLYAVLLGVFAAVAVALAAVGIYGVLAFVVTRRTREIGIRVALGAQRSQVIALTLRDTAALTSLGIVIGVGGAAALSRYLEGLLFGVTPLDGPTFVFVVVLFVVVAALASFVPARRAARVDPAVALRAE
jgi:putative ABC transport system permease protein